MFSSKKADPKYQIYKKENGMRGMEIENTFCFASFVLSLKGNKAIQ